MHCNNCNIFFPESLYPPPPSMIGVILRCQICDRLVEVEFRFCPF
ncbi:hypothetical protein LINPERPRIM_LOCUS25053 [Linum perenne]